MAQRVLYQFPVSHYCEKARWLLDFKGLSYDIHNQLPGPHARTNRRLTGQPSVPVLIDGDTAIGGSHAIALHLERAYPDAPALVPTNADARAQLDAIVRYFDDHAGPAVRRFVYSLVVPEVALFRALFFRNYGGISGFFGRISAGPVSRVITRMYKVNEHSVAESAAIVRAAADYAEGLLKPAQPYVIGDRFSLADLSIASLMAPLIGPAGSPWDVELDLPTFKALRAELRARPIGAYVTRCYNKHRH